MAHLWSYDNVTLILRSEPLSEGVCIVHEHWDIVLRTGKGHCTQHWEGELHLRSTQWPYRHMVG